MNKIFKFLLLTTFVIFGLQSCDDDDTIVGGGIIPEPELLGCEATTFYDWSDFQFETSLDAGATTWLGFDLSETTLFSINLNQAGFHCAIFEFCDGELGAPPPLYSFMSNGNGQEVGIVTEGMYYLEITNTRPGRLDFTFDISLNDIVYGCLNDDALNYDETANVDDGSCEFNDCNTEFLNDAYGDMVLDCNGNCSPANWVGDGWCDDGAYAVYQNEEAYNNYQNCQAEGTDDCSQYLVAIDLYCADLNWDEGDCEAIDEGCSGTEIEDCNGICAPESWLGDGYCDEGNYEYNGNPIFFNCEEFNNDNGDCDGTFRQIQQPKYPNGRIPIR